jgi:hypothetical protein
MNRTTLFALKYLLVLSFSSGVKPNLHGAVLSHVMVGDGASWRCNPCLIRDNDAMAAALKVIHGFPTRPSAKKKASDQEFAIWQTRNPKIDILRSILNQIMQILNMICMPQ